MVSLVHETSLSRYQVCSSTPSLVYFPQHHSINSMVDFPLSQHSPVASSSHTTAFIPTILLPQRKSFQICSSRSSTNSLLRRSHPSPQFLPLLRRITLRRPRMNSRYFRFQCRVHQSVSGERRFLLEEGGHDYGRVGLAAAA